MKKLVRLNWFAFGESNYVAVWRKRVAFRRALAEILVTNPHMIEDIGMTEQEVEAEIAKRFWQK